MPSLFEIFGRSNQPQSGAVLTGNQQQTGAPTNTGGNGTGNGYVPSSQQLNPQNNNNQPNPPGEGGAPGGGNPANNADPTKGQGPGSLLDPYKDLFTIDTNKEGQPIVHNDLMTQPLVQLDPAKLKEAAAKMNFAQGISPDLAQKALGGDIASFMQVINSVAQNAFMAATASAGSVADSAIRTNNERFESVLPDRVRQVQIRQSATKHPALAHPAAQPVVEALKLQVAAKNPTMSPDKVTEVAEGYVIAMSQDINNHNQLQTQTNRGAGEPDYSIFLPTV